MQLKHKAQSRHNDIAVYDTDELYGEKGRFRVLQFSDGAIQGAADLNRPERIVFEYPRALLHLMEANNPGYEDIFLIGHGIGTLAGHMPGRRLKTAELDEAVEEVSRRFFGYEGDPVAVGDGRDVLRREPDGAYDYVVLDAFGERGTPRHLVSAPFFTLAKDKLHPGGSVLMNLFGRGGSDPLINAIHTTLSGRFPYTKAFLLPSGHARDVRNWILAGSGKPILFQARQMAGFAEAELEPGYTIENP